MYSSEIETFLKERNYAVTPEECNLLMDINTNTQITHMKYIDNEYYIYTDDGYSFVFKVKQKDKENSDYEN